MADESRGRTMTMPATDTLIPPGGTIDADDLPAFRAAIVKQLAGT